MEDARPPDMTAYPRVGAHPSSASVGDERAPDRALRTVLCTITPMITSATDTTFLDQLVPAVCELFDAPRCSVMLLEVPGDTSSKLRLQAHAGLPATAVGCAPAGGVAARVLQLGQPVLIVDRQDFDLRFGGLAAKGELSSSICVPIATPRGSIFGIINVARSASGARSPFDARDLELCDAIAMLVGDALERLQSREAERELRERMRAVERLSMLGEVAAGIAHEIANPMASVQANITAIAEYITEILPVLSALQSAPDATVVELEGAQEELAAIAADLPALIGDVQEGVERVDEIIANMKAMVRFESHDQGHHCADIAKVATSVLKLGRPRLQCRVELAIPDGLMAEVRPIDLTQVLLNLIVNANDACVEQKNRQEPAITRVPLICVNAFVDEFGVAIDVVDNGTGIEQKDLRRMFQPLFTTKGTKGTGLGLSLSRRLLEENGGTMEVSSIVGVGTTIRMRLPPAGRAANH